MAKDKNQRPNFKAFLKKRAPIYLGLLGLFVIFAVPEITKSDLPSLLPELSVSDQKVLDVLMEYAGPNGSGLTVMDALSNKIAEAYPNERIYDNKKTNVELSVSKIDSENYKVIFDFKSYKGEMNYDWDINVNSQDIKSNNKASRHVINVVDYYD